MHTTLPSDKKLWPETWLVKARWYFAPLAFLFSWLTAGDVTSKTVDPALIASLAVILTGNIIFSFYLRKTATSEEFAKFRSVFNVSQIGLDLVFFLFVLLFSGNIHGIASAFFFIPIIASAAILGLNGAVIVATTSGFLVVGATLYDQGLLGGTLVGMGDSSADRGTLILLGETGVLFILYVIAGFLGGLISRSVERRDLLLLGEIAKGEEQVKRLQKLTDEFDQSAKLLVRRDIELTSANEKLTQLDRMKSEIISVVAHQLRTPLSAIKWTLKMLIDEDTGKITDEQKGLLTKGFDSNERMVVLINDMLAVDHLESGKLKYNFIPVQFESLIEEVVNSLLPIATHRKIIVEFLAPKELLPKVKLDPDKMRDVLQNLIDNAIKYSKDGGRVTMGVAMEGEELHFWIKDSGIGIPEDAKGKIFSRFFRAANAISAETDGSGLGLFIAQSIAKRHGGRIWLESSMNEGSTFHVMLPVAP